MNRKTLLALLGFFLLAFIIFGIWFFFFSRTSSNTNPDSANQTQNFFPVTTTFNPETNDTNSEDSQQNNEQFIPRLRQLSNVPTAGMVSFERGVDLIDPILETEDATNTPEKIIETVFRYVDRAKGNIYETTERTLEQTRLSNTTIPKVNEAYFNTTGDKVIFRYLADDGETIETFLGSLQINESASSSNPTLGEIVGSYLEANISNLATLGNQITYLLQNLSGSEVITRTFDDATTRTIYSNPLSNFIIERSSADILTLTTKADSRVFGYLLFVNTSSGIPFTTIGELNGLTTTTSPDGKYILYTQSRGGSITTNVFETESGGINFFNYETLVEKCVWSKKESTVVYCAIPKSIPVAQYPQDWYQGKVSLSDDLWRIDLDLFSFEKILDPSDSGKSFDVIKPTLTENDEYLMFINKNDLTLWSYDILGINQ